MFIGDGVIEVYLCRFIEFLNKMEKLTIAYDQNTKKMAFNAGGDSEEEND